MASRGGIPATALALLAAACLAGCEPEGTAGDDASRTPPATRAATDTARRPGTSRFAAGVAHAADANALAAAKRAAREAVAACKARGAEPVAAVFLERFDGQARTGEIGGAVKAVAGVPTYGQGTPAGGSATGVTVLVLGGASLEVAAVADGGRIAHEDSDASADAARVRKLREACTDRGQAFARRIRPPTRPGFVLLLGAIESDWHATFFTPVHERLGKEVPLIGGVGTWEDAIYLDGRPVRDAEGKPTNVGRLAVVVQGRLRVATACVPLSNRWNPAAVRIDRQHAASAAQRGLGGAECGLLLAVTPVGVGSGGVAPDSLAGAGFPPATPLLPLPLTGQVGTTAEGVLSVGADRVALCAVASAADPTR